MDNYDSELGLVVSGAALEAVEKTLPKLIDNNFASRLQKKDPTLWGKDAESEAAIRLDWVDLPKSSRELIEPVCNLRKDLQKEGITRFVLAGMGGSSLAPEVITNTFGVELTIIDTTNPEQIAQELAINIQETALIVSSKSGSTVETDAVRRAYTTAFEKVGINPSSRIIVITDPGSALEKIAHEEKYRAVFLANPNVGGRYSALSAFGLVPSGLAGADIENILDSAAETAEFLCEDSEENIALVLGSALAGTVPLRDKIVFVDEDSSLLGFADWAEQLLAESTGKNGTGLLPVIVEEGAFELKNSLDDTLIVRLRAEDSEDDESIFEDSDGDEIILFGSLGAQIILWEFATAVAGYLLNINPFDQPDVEAAKIAARGLLEERPKNVAADFIESSIAISGSTELLADNKSLESVIRSFCDLVPQYGYISVQAYLNRLNNSKVSRIREDLAAISRRPVTFGWGPRFLHSTGQYHKGGPKNGIFLQLLETTTSDVNIDGMPFTFGQLIQAQAAGDAAVLENNGSKVLRLNILDNETGVDTLMQIIENIRSESLEK